MVESKDFNALTELNKFIKDNNIKKQDIINVQSIPASGKLVNKIAHITLWYNKRKGSIWT